ncbi:MAG: hypothetical protein WDA18_09310 [Candidatus Ratteibacteria bacterium]|nr:hypothetical protein [Candidatus Cloacimonadota bacterium]
MIRIKVGDELYEFQGTIEVTPEVKYVFEKENPFVANQPFRHGKYYTDKLQISILASSAEYESLFYLVMGCEEFLVAWETLSGYQWRKLKEKLPYPSQLRYLDGKIDFALESLPYYEINSSMENITKNMKWNISTIENTILN